MKEVNLADLTREELREHFLEGNLKPFRGDQVFSWINHKLCVDYSQMTNLSKELREQLKNLFPLKHPLKLLQYLESKDGSMKFAFATEDGYPLESVLIPTGKNKGTYTICLSSQSGCAMGCKFCSTARMGFGKNLATREITFQVYQILLFLEKNGYQSDKPLEQWISNIVFMGMGEPLQNLNNLVDAVEILTDSKGINFSRRKITISTCGLVPQMEELFQLEKINFKLAVSLNSADDNLRSKLMPINKKYPIEQLTALLKKLKLPERDRITIEYVLFSGLNDNIQAARKLVDLLKNIPVKINLIPYNESTDQKFIDKIQLKAPSEQRINEFARILRNNHYNVTVRRSYGQDIKAACGQLVQSLKNSS
ncbi:MAG: 23S rRNA (adenine(2503)-C(2))-methyltransferase RlmN [Myxococcota bacterium]